MGGRACLAVKGRGGIKGPRARKRTPAGPTSSKPPAVLRGTKKRKEVKGGTQLPPSSKVVRDGRSPTPKEAALPPEPAPERTRGRTPEAVAEEELRRLPNTPAMEWKGSGGEGESWGDLDSEEAELAVVTCEGAVSVSSSPEF